MDTESDTESTPSGVALTISLLQGRLKELEQLSATAQADVDRFDEFLATRNADITRYARESWDVNRALEILQAAQ